jgi:hypothetical protein
MSPTVLVPQGFRGTLTDDDAGSHGIAGGHARHDRAVCNAKVFDPIDLNRRSLSTWKNRFFDRSLYSETSRSDELLLALARDWDGI